MFTLPTGSIADLSNRAVFRLTGPDTERYLSGQITQDLKLATEDQAVYSCVTNAKGKIQGEAYVRRHNGAVLIDCPGTLREELFQRLDMYLIADDVELVDVSDDYTLFHVLGESPGGNDCWSCQRYGVSGYDVLTSADGNLTSPEEWEKLRIAHAIPAWGSELSDSILPPEAKLEQRAISYTKGCYIGQEVISRMKSAGKVTKSISSFSLSEEVELPFSIPNPEKPEAKPVGTITSQATIDGKVIGLGFLSTKFSHTETFICDSVNISPLSHV